MKHTIATETVRKLTKKEANNRLRGVDGFANTHLDLLSREILRMKMPAGRKAWRVFLDCRPFGIAVTKSAKAAIALIARTHSLPRARLAALDEDFVVAYERRLERRQRKRLTASCHHEAGHAVLAHHLGARVVSLSTIPRMMFGGDIATDQDSMGRMGWETPPDHPRWTPGTARDAEAKALVSLAGLAAEFRFTGRSRWRSLSWQGDIERATALAEAFPQTAPGNATTVFENWKSAAKSGIELLWPHVARVAAALEGHRELAADDLAKLLRRVPRSTDPYRT